VTALDLYSAPKFGRRQMERTETPTLGPTAYAPRRHVPGGDAAEEGRRFVTVQATTSALAPAAVATRAIAYIIDAIILGICGIFILGLIINDLTIVGSITRAIIYGVLGFL